MFSSLLHRPSRLITPLTTAVFLLLLTLASACSHSTANDAAQRRDFIAAERALAAGDAETYRGLEADLRDYPLWPYLRLAALRAQLSDARTEEIEAFIDAHAGTAPGETLRRLWLNRLHAAGDSAGYVRNYSDNGSETRECRYRAALLAVGRTEDAFDGLEQRYLTGASLPDVCDPVFARWHAAGGLTTELVWRRIGLALARGNAGVAGFQRRYLPARDQRWLDQQLALYRNPEGLRDAELPDDPERRIAALIAGIERLANRDASLAAADWSVLQHREPVPPSAKDRANTAIGAGLAAEGTRSALVYLRRLRPLPENLELQRTRLRAALRLQAWPELVEWIALLPTEERERGEWQYWLARGLSKAGDRVGAAHALDIASRERDLWGFRAAELLGRPPALRERPTPADPEEIERLLRSDTARRIRELQALGRDADVRREWRELSRTEEPEGLRRAAVLGQRLGLVKEAIFTLARGEYWDDIRLRFPLLYNELIQGYAADRGLPLEWVYAVIRQESVFDADVASHAGAVGLMQVMPATAREVARDEGLPPPRRLDLIDPALNIALGTSYLAKMRRRFGGNQVLATAAYNAGPGAVSRWLPDEPVAADLWMIDIPYSETRDYVRRVMTYRVIYAHRIGLKGFRLGALFAPVRPTSPSD
jgi:soluble lytic murein transglycosylase